MESIKGWNTESEMKYLRDEIGRSSPATLEIEINRVEMLERYLEGALKRMNWKGLDRTAILRCARAQIQMSRYGL